MKYQLQQGERWSSPFPKISMHQYWVYQVVQWCSVEWALVTESLSWLLLYLLVQSQVTHSNLLTTL